VAAATEDRTPAVVARDVWKQYPMGDVTVDALRGVDLDLPSGKFVVLLGPSGSGKTTLLNLAGGLDTPTRGELSVCGHTLTGMREDRLTEFRRTTIGFVFQMFNLVPTLTALENIRLVAQLVGNDSMAAQVLADVELEDFADHLPAQLSGGQQQRVAIARALVKQPRILLADEPTGALDAETGQRVISLLWDQTRRNDMTLIMVTHNEMFAEAGDILVRLRSGQVVDVTAGGGTRPDQLGA